MSCLEKTPDKRPASAVELWRELGDVPLTPPWDAERAESWWREHLPQFAGLSLAGDSSAELTIPPVQWTSATT